MEQCWKTPLTSLIICNAVRIWPIKALITYSKFLCPTLDTWSKSKCSVLIKNHNLFFGFRKMITESYTIIINPENKIYPKSFDIFKPISTFISLIMAMPAFTSQHFIIINYRSYRS